MQKLIAVRLDPKAAELLALIEDVVNYSSSGTTNLAPLRRLQLALGNTVTAQVTEGQYKALLARYETLKDLITISKLDE